MNLEYCSECSCETGNAGRMEDSIFIMYPDYEVGPLCDKCREAHRVCEKCGEGVPSNLVTFDNTHEVCGGICN